MVILPFRDLDLFLHHCESHSLKLETENSKEVKSILSIKKLSVTLFDDG